MTNAFAGVGDYSDEFLPPTTPYDPGDIGDYGSNPIGNSQSGFPKQYGTWNFAGAAVTKTLRFLPINFALRSSITKRNMGAVYKRNPKRTGGVLADDSGLMPTYGYLGSRRAPFRGVLYALTPVPIPSQTILSQWGATPDGYSGDTPTDLQQSVQNAPPWRRGAARGDSRQSFRSGIMRGLRV